MSVATHAPPDVRESAAADFLAALPPDDREAAMRRIDARVKLTADPDTLGPRLHFEQGLGEIATGGIPAPEQLAEGLIYRNRVHWLSGHPGHGKTTFAMWIAKRHMDAGGDVIWLDWEAGTRPTVARLLAIGATPEQIEARFHLVYSPRIEASAGGFEPLRAALDSYPGALVVFDSASKALSVAGFDENSSTEATKWTTEIILPTREAGATVMVIDHVVKNATRSTPYARGAGSKLADTDAHWYVERTAPFSRDRVGAIRLSRQKDREGCLPEALAFEVGDGAGNLPVNAIEVEDEGHRSKREAGLRQKVETILQEHSTPDRKLTTSQVVQLVAANKSGVLGALAELTADRATGIRQEPGANNAILYWHDPDAASGLDIR